MQSNVGLGEKISVCLLTFNHVDLVESTIRSVLYQTVAGHEVIVSDDCSTDGTWERVSRLADQDSRIVPIRTPQNLGVAGNANFAVSQSARPYIALLHHDDLYRKDLLERWVGVMERNADVGFVFNPYGVFESDLVHKHPMHPFSSERLDGTWFLDRILFPSWGCWVRGTAMIRRSVWTAVGGMHGQFGLLADIDLWMRLAAAAPVGYVTEPVITIRQARPSYYPDIYTGKKWSWLRQRYLYEIHATNRRRRYAQLGAAGRLQWWRFRFRLSLATAKWLAYAVVRRKVHMIETSGDSVTPYDLWWLRILRGTLQALHSMFGRRNRPT